MTHSDVASTAGARDVKTIRNPDTGRSGPNDLTRRGVQTALGAQTALVVEIGAPDRVGEGGDTGEVEQRSAVARVGGLGATPSVQELIDLSSAITKSSAAPEAMLRRGDDSNAETLRSRIDAVSAVVAGFGPALKGTVARVPRDAEVRLSSG